MHTVNSRVHRPTIVGAALALFFSLVFIATPAQADPALTFTADVTTVELGQPVTLSWSATGSMDIVASGAWSGGKAVSGSEVVIPTTTGSITYTLTANEPNGRDALNAVESVTINVTPAALPEVTPAAVTFPDSCTVVVPSTAGVIYSVTIDGFTEVIDADTYDGADFDGHSAAVFTAAADDEHVIKAGSTVTWSYTPGDECFGGLPSNTIVTTKTSCSAVTFTNITDQAAEVFYGDRNNAEADGDFVLAPGATKTVKTSRSSLDFVADTGAGGLFQFDSVDVSQDCGNQVSDPKPTKRWPVKHPTVAPAAGVTGDDNGPATPFLVLLGIATLIAVRRAYSLGS